MRWTITNEKIWEEITLFDDDHIRRPSTRCYVQLEDFEIDETISQIAINSSNALFILKNSELNKYLVKLIEKLSNNSVEDKFILSKTVGLLTRFFYYKDLDESKVIELIENAFQRNSDRHFEKLVWGKVDKQELISTILKTNFIKYDTTIWYRRSIY